MLHAQDVSAWEEPTANSLKGLATSLLAQAPQSAGSVTRTSRVASPMMAEGPNADVDGNRRSALIGGLATSLVFPEVARAFDKIPDTFEEQKKAKAKEAKRKPTPKPTQAPAVKTTKAPPVAKSNPAPTLPPSKVAKAAPKAKPAPVPVTTPAPATVAPAKKPAMAQATTVDAQTLGLPAAAVVAAAAISQGGKKDSEAPTPRKTKIPAGVNPNKVATNKQGSRDIDTGRDLYAFKEYEERLQKDKPLDVGAVPSLAVFLGWAGVPLLAAVGCLLYGIDDFSGLMTR